VRGTFNNGRQINRLPIHRVGKTYEGTGVGIATETTTMSHQY
jgi:hypothetical protein